MATFDEAYLKHYAAICLKCESRLTLRNVLSIRNSDLKCALSVVHTSVQLSQSLGPERSIQPYPFVIYIGNFRPAN